MLSDTPVIVADIPVLREVVGDAGIYCDPHDVSSITQAIQKLEAMKPAARKALTGKARTRAARFSWEASATKLYAFLKEKVGHDD